MADKFTRSSVLLKWSGGATIRAFHVFIEDYQGGGAENAKAFERNLSGTLVVVRGGSIKRTWTAGILLDHDASGSLDGATLGTDVEAYSAWSATDLYIKSFEDADYWGAEVISPWNPQTMGPTGNERILYFQAIEK